MTEKQKNMKNYIFNFILIFAFTSCIQTNTNNGQQEIDSLKNEIIRLENELKQVSITSKSDKLYLHGVPQAPPFRKIKLTIRKQVTEGCGKIDEPIIGYIITVNKSGNICESFVLQNEEGVQEQIYIESSEMSEADKSWLPYIIIPGNKVKIIVERCGSGSFPNVMYVESLSR
jgi:hypothetical protein